MSSDRIPVELNSDAPPSDPSAIQLPIFRDSMRVFGKVEVKKVAVNNMRLKMVAQAQLAHADDLQRLGHIVRQLQSRWESMSPDARRTSDFLPSFISASDNDKAFFDRVREQWCSIYVDLAQRHTTLPDESFSDGPDSPKSRKYIKKVSRKTVARWRIKTLRYDAFIDLCRLCGDHYSVLKHLYESWILRPSLRANYPQDASGFFVMTRLPPSDVYALVGCSRTVFEYGLHHLIHDPNLANPFQESMDEIASKFVLDFEESYRFYLDMSDEYTAEESQHPRGEEHTLKFESKESYLLRTESWDYSLGYYDRSQLQHILYVNNESRRWFGSLEYANYEFQTAEDIQHADSVHASMRMHAEQERYIDSEISSPNGMLMTEELLAAIVRPTTATVFIGCGSFDRLYSALMYLAPRDLLDLFMEQPRFAQFHSLIKWAAWQLCDWQNIWYLGAVYDDALLDEIERTIVDPPNHVLTPTQLSKYKVKTYWKRQLALPADVTLTFEDVIASVPWASNLHSIRQAMFTAFPPQAVATYYDVHPMDVQPRGFKTFEDAFQQAWKSHMSPDQRRDYEERNESVGALVDYVVRVVTFAQLIEKAQFLTLKLEHLSAIVQWQFTSTPKVDVLKYIITRLVPNAPTLEMLRQAKRFPLPSMDTYENQISWKSLIDKLNVEATLAVRLFMQYAKWIKEQHKIHATLMSAKVHSALTGGVFKTMPVTKRALFQGATHPTDFEYTTPARLGAVPIDVMEEVLLPYLGIQASNELRIITPKEYLVLNPDFQSQAAQLNPRHQPAFISRSPVPFYLPIRSQEKQNTQTTAAVRSLDSDGESSSSKRAR